MSAKIAAVGAGNAILRRGRQHDAGEPAEVPQFSRHQLGFGSVEHGGLQGKKAYRYGSMCHPPVEATGFGACSRSHALAASPIREAPAIARTRNTIVAMLSQKSRFPAANPVVPQEGLEPPHPREYQILSLARLPVPPLRQLINFEF